MLSLSGTWYFAPVATDDVPLSEAAFLGRASYVGAIAARFELFDTRLDAQAASIGYYFPGTMFFAGAGVSRSEQVIALNSTTRLTDHFTQWFGTLGIAPIDGLLITTELGEGGYDPNLRARHVGKLPNSHFYAGSVSIVDPDEGDTSIGVDFDYFLDDSTSVGAGYQDGPDRLEVRAERFFSGSWAAGVSAYTADGSERPTRATVKNESVGGLGNARGTIAMARKPDPDSAAAQFYFNLKDNDALNAKGDQPGYTVFGRIVQGEDVLDRIGAAPTVNNGGAFVQQPREPILIIKAKRI
jgi:cyclophilin family peptidyl-prolyl cis-trans isomerase